MSLLEFKDVSYTGDHRIILNSISINIALGDFISVIGPSGSGKSTFLKLCCHLITPSQGEILYKSKNIFEYDPLELRKNIAYSFQTPYLFGNIVEDNLSFPYSIRNIKTDWHRINEMLSLLHFEEGFLKKEIKNLSGGEKQRIALIRTLLFRPKILLLDEVTSALDADNALIVENLISSFHREGMAVLWITHHPGQGRNFANKVLTIENGTIKSLEVLR